MSLKTTAASSLWTCLGIAASCLIGLIGCLTDGKQKSDEPAIKFLRKDLYIDAGRDTTVSIRDSVKLHARVTQKPAPIASLEWDIGNQGFFRIVSGDTIIHAGTDSGRLRNILRVKDVKGNVAYDTMEVSVLLCKPRAFAGSDTVVTVSDSVWLRGRGSDSLGRIVRMEWDIGAKGTFREIQRDTAVLAGKDIGFEYHILRITDDDGWIVLDTFAVKVYDDLPVVKAKKTDRSAGEGGGILFTADASDRGRVVKYEWDFGTGRFTEGPRDTVLHFPQPAGSIVQCRLKVTDDDGNWQTDSLAHEVLKWTRVGRAYFLDQRAKRDYYMQHWVYQTCGLAGKLFLTRVTLGANPDSSVAASFDPKTQKWKMEVHLPGLVDGNSLVDWNGRLLSIGGRNVLSPEGNGLVYEYIPAFAEWVPKHQMPANLKAGRAVVSEGAVYYFGFTKYEPERSFANPPANSDSVSVYKYDPKGDAWTFLSNYVLSPGPGAWRIVSTAAISGRIYVAGNMGGRTRIFEYSPGTGTWLAKAALDETFEDLNGTASDQKLYILGGIGAKYQFEPYVYTPAEKKFFAYDPATDTWERKSKPNEPHGQPSPVYADGLVYDLSDSLMLEQYDPKDEP
jgi:hypothetical protein